jgi:hypothetical protein
MSGRTGMRQPSTHLTPQLAFVQNWHNIFSRFSDFPLTRYYEICPFLTLGP